MTRTAAKNLLNWWLPCFAGIFAALCSLSLMFLGSFDILQMLYVFVLVPLLSLGFAVAVLMIALRKRRAPHPAVFLMLPVFWAVTWLLFKSTFELRSEGRWAFSRGEYKSKVLAQSAGQNGNLKHIEWDSWGIAGEDSVAYLVFDPNDSLAAPARSQSSGEFAGIPCAVSRIRRLESHYYIVLFYTATDWDQCD